ncbi:hypothetical protein CK203_072335 [Vitis vinifera]|uniref:Uncharacterized protein n=1 Tax=Vitis vinifera TaxID=29760 RepID=A0A438E8A6_VITVI|nr:hypothetical protein CK203_072335 [Vitis vinifera]
MRETKDFPWLSLKEGGLLEAGKCLASKLRSVGVAPLQWRGVCWRNNHLPKSHPAVANEELLGRCLVGSWEGDADRLPDPVSFGSWAKNSWFLEGNLWLSNVRENLMLLEFEFETKQKGCLAQGQDVSEEEASA